MWPFPSALLLWLSLVTGELSAFGPVSEQQESRFCRLLQESATKCQCVMDPDTDQLQVFCFGSVSGLSGPLRQSGLEALSELALWNVDDVHRLSDFGQLKRLDHFRVFNPKRLESFPVPGTVSIGTVEVVLNETHHADLTPLFEFLLTAHGLRNVLLSGANGHLHRLHLNQGRCLPWRRLVLNHLCTIVSPSSEQRWEITDPNHFNDLCNIRVLDLSCTGLIRFRFPDILSRLAQTNDESNGGKIHLILSHNPLKEIVPNRDSSYPQVFVEMNCLDNDKQQLFIDHLTKTYPNLISINDCVK